MLVACLAARRLATACSAAVLAMIVAVVSYYCTATAWQGDDLANAARATAGFWYLAGVVVGVLAGIAAVWMRTTTDLRRAVGAAFPVAVLLGEAGLDFRDSAPGHSGAAFTAAVLAVLAVVLGAVLARSLRRAPAVWLASLPLAVIAYAVFRVVGFSGHGG